MKNVPVTIHIQVFGHIFSLFLGRFLGVEFLGHIDIVMFPFFNINLFIYLFLAALGLRCCVWAFSSCSEWGLLFIAVHGLLTAVASLVAEHGL